MVQSLTGSLLVAAPELLDPNFRRSVIYVLLHGEDGALGLVLNRPTELELTAALPQWADAATEPPVIFAGGPVELGAALCLAEVEPGSEPLGWTPLSPTVGTFDVSADFLDRSAIRRLRVFLGYAGWDGGQLEAEIAEGSWYVLDAQPSDALTSTPDALWREVLRRQQGTLAMVSLFPDDPKMN
ncbi:MAG: YqgE/AlgH family protein [Actinomycetota bacterium]|nr:YqgE/AlgH family protein [Actinomycetota bacterium]